MYRATCTFGGCGSDAGSPSGPTVTTARTESLQAASTTAESAALLLNTVPNVTYTSPLGREERTERLVTVGTLGEAATTGPANSEFGEPAVKLRHPFFLGQPARRHLQAGGFEAVTDITAEVENAWANGTIGLT